MKRVFIAAAVALGACGDGLSGVPVPDSVDRAQLDSECIEALMTAVSAQTCLDYCTACEPDAVEPCTDRCSMGEVVVENIRLAEDLVCWQMAGACEAADIERCSEPDDWIDFENAIGECADDVAR